MFLKRSIVAIAAFVAAATAQIELNLSIGGQPAPLRIEAGQDANAVVQQYITNYNLDQAAIEVVIKAVNEMLAAPPAAPPAEPLSLNVGIGNLVVRPGVEPADVVHTFVAQASAAGHTVTRANVDDIMTYFCQRTQCTRAVEEINLNVGIGDLKVAIGQEPADVIEEFVQQAVAAGHQITMDDVQTITNNLCARRQCTRAPNVQGPAPAQEPVSLTVEGVGSMTVSAGQEAADVVAEFINQAAGVGAPIDLPTAEKIMQYFCERTPCTKNLNLN